MKKRTGAFIAALIVFFAISDRAAAQVHVGGGLIYASDMGNFDLGIQAGGYFGLEAIPALRLGADLEFYLPQSQTFSGHTVTNSFVAFNANAHYFLITGETAEVYGLGGLTYGRLSTSGNSLTEIDINLGAGAEFPMAFGRPYGELKVVTGDFDRLVLAAGIRIPF